MCETTPRITLKDEESITVNGIEYTFDSFSKALFSESLTEKKVMCPACFRTEFSISYGSYECFAHCACGHTMSIYSG